MCMYVCVINHKLQRSVHRTCRTHCTVATHMCRHLCLRDNIARTTQRALHSTHYTASCGAGGGVGCQLWCRWCASCGAGGTARASCGAGGVAVCQLWYRWCCEVQVVLRCPSCGAGAVVGCQLWRRCCCGVSAVVQVVLQDAGGVAGSQLLCRCCCGVPAVVLEQHATSVGAGDWFGVHGRIIHGRMSCTPGLTRRIRHDDISGGLWEAGHSLAFRDQYGEWGAALIRVGNMG